MSFFRRLTWATYMVVASETLLFGIIFFPSKAEAALAQNPTIVGEVENKVSEFISAGDFLGLKAFIELKPDIVSLIVFFASSIAPERAPEVAKIAIEAVPLSAVEIAKAAAEAAPKHYSRIVIAAYEAAPPELRYAVQQAVIDALRLPVQQLGGVTSTNSTGIVVTSPGSQISTDMPVVMEPNPSQAASPT